MASPFRSAWLICLAGVCLSSPLPAQTAVDAPLRVAVRGAAAAPGDAVLVTVSASRTLPRLEGEVFGRPVHFWPSGSDRSWYGLAAVPLDTRPGAYTLTVRSPDPAPPLTTAISLRVRPKVFETRQLRVASRFVDPPADEAQRIAREAKMLSDLFAASTERLWRGAFVVPVPGRATSSFGRLSVLNGQPRSRHQGADFAAASGTPVVAPNAGRVVLAEDLYFSGNTIVIDHGGGLFSLLAHLSRLDVAAGAPVARGTRLGLSGATGRVTGPHLHWAVRLGELSVDPQSLMRALSGIPDAAEPIASR